MKDKAWTGRTGGSGWMQQTLIRWFRHIDTRWCYWIVVLWVPGSMLFQPNATRGAWRYWRQRQHKRFFAAVWCLLRQYYAFGDVILDRFAAYAGQPFDIQIDDPDNTMNRLQQSDNAGIVISTHVGNQELAGYCIPSVKPMRVVLYLGDTPTVNANRERLFAEKGLSFIPMQPDGSHIFEMHEALQRGEILSIHGDRLFYGGRAMRAQLLGAQASFPEGPYRVAALERVPVMTMFMIREGHKRYTLHIRSLSREGDDQLGNAQLAQNLLERFAAELEQMLAKRPEQWFHFYDFWETEKTK